MRKEGREEIRNVKREEEQEEGASGKEKEEAAKKDSEGRGRGERIWVICVSETYLKMLWLSKH